METALKMVRRHYPMVTSVIDATKPIEIAVNRRDCATAKAKSFTGCAFANACKRTDGFDGAIVALSVAYLIKGKKAVRYKVGNTLSREITVMDRTKKGERFRPTKFKLRPASPQHRLGHKTSHSPKRRKVVKARQKPIHTADVRHIRAY